jgi:hypothetical protein
MTRTARIEGRVQIGIMLFMGGLAGAASFKHIHDLAVAYGQPSWIGWADAVVVELMSIVSGLEIRRRKRARPKQSTRFVYLVFSIAVLISLAAQVAKAHPSPWGWIMAALPALGFLAVVKIILTRQPIETEPVRTEVVSGPDQPDVEQAGPVGAVNRSTDREIGPVQSADRSTDPNVRTHTAAPAGTSQVEQVRSETADGPNEAERWDVDRTTENLDVPAQRINGNHTGSPQARPTGDERPPLRSGPRGTRTGPDRARPDSDLSGPDRARPDSDLSGPDRARSDADLSGPDRTGLDEELLQLGLTIAAKVRMRKDTLTRQVLIDEIRGEGRTIGTDRASNLLNWIKTAEAASVGAD